MQFRNSLSKFCSRIFKNAHNKKNIVTMPIIIIFIGIDICKAITDREEAASIKYTTCLKLKYPPNIFSSLLVLNGILKTRITYLPYSKLPRIIRCNIDYNSCNDK